MNLDELISARTGTPPLEPDTVHVWRLSTETTAENLQALESLLSADESTRAGRFYAERDRRRFITCRGCLRLLVAAYSGKQAERIHFRYGPQGKPALSNSAALTEQSEDKPRQGMDLRFNVSHSGELALFAFSIDREVGVDVELMRPDLDFLSLARISFSPAEERAVAALPAESRGALFYQYWSSKEACIKADGRGVSAGLDQFTIISTPEPEWRRIAVAAAGSLSKEMRVRILEMGAGYAAAVAAPSAGWDVALLSLK